MSEEMQHYIGDKPVSEDEYWETLIARGAVTSKPHARDVDLDALATDVSLVDEFTIRQLWDQRDKAIQLAKVARDERDATLAENLRLKEVLQAVVDVDPDPCRLDHHGNCQAHYLGNPCHIAEAKKLLGGERGE